MTVIPVQNSLIDESESAVKLVRYADILGISEEQFFGINRPSTRRESCQPIWTLDQRKMVARYLKEAQTEIEQITKFPLSPRWITDEFRYYGYPLHAQWTKIIAAGFKHSTTIQAGKALVMATDPATFTQATTVTDEDEIKIYHPGTTVEIIPSALTISAGNIIASIPWARLVKLSKQDNDENGLTYTDATNYETTVDIVRVYNDESIQGGLFWHHRDSGGSCDCTCDWCCATCGDYSENACIYIRNPETGALDLLPATYSENDLEWTASCLTCYCSAPDSVRLNYKAGLETLTPQVEDAIIRLAHSKMPQSPCGCNVAQEFWSRDRNVPAVLDAVRLQCPFGISDGSWFAWKQANALKFQPGFAM